MSQTSLFTHQTFSNLYCIQSNIIISFIVCNDLYGFFPYPPGIFFIQRFVSGFRSFPNGHSRDILFNR